MKKLNDNEVPVLPGSLIMDDGTPVALGITEYGVIVQSTYTEFATLVEWKDIVDLCFSYKPQDAIQTRREIQKPKAGKA